MIDGRDAMTRLAFGAFHYSGAAPLLSRYLNGVGAVLMLHRVTAQPPGELGVNAHLQITPAFLDATLARMKGLGYQFVGMDEAVDRIAARARQRFATITADDGYRDNLREALPVLEKHGAPITIYVAPGLTNGSTDLWWTVLEEIVAARDFLYLATREGRVRLNCATLAAKRAAYRQLQAHLIADVGEAERQATLRDLAGSAGVDPAEAGRRLLMDWDEIRDIARHPLVTIGAHTVNHYHLRRLSVEQAAAEMADADRILEIELGERPRHFAYPYGYAAAVGPREVELARAAGYASAVTTRHGVLQPQHARHLHALPRISMNGRFQKVAHVRTMLSGVTTLLANSGQRVVTV